MRLVFLLGIAGLVLLRRDQRRLRAPVPMNKKPGQAGATQIGGRRTPKGRTAGPR